MKPAFAVLNVLRPAFDEKDGLKFGPGSLTESGAYTANFFSNLEKAEKFADGLARTGTAAAIFDLQQVRIIRPTPVEVITISRS